VALESLQMKYWGWEWKWKWKPQAVVYSALGAGVPFEALAVEALADKYCRIKVFAFSFSD
jgi:hypothetical protein